MRTKELQTVGRTAPELKRMQAGIHAYIREMPKPDNTLKRSGRVALELVNGDEIRQCYYGQRGAMLRGELYQWICLPPPPRARYPVTRTIEAIEFAPSDTYLLNIDAIIDDSDGQLAAERALYARRMQRLGNGRSHYDPLDRRITIMTISPYVATAALMSFVESRAPDSLSLSAINMRPGHINYNYS